MGGSGGRGEEAPREAAVCGRGARGGGGSEALTRSLRSARENDRAVREVLDVEQPYAARPREKLHEA